MTGGKLRYIVSRRNADGSEDTVSPYWLMIDRHGHTSHAGRPYYSFEMCFYDVQRANDGWLFKGEAYNG